MRTNTVRAFALSALAAVLMACATSPRPLDLSALPQGDIALASVTVMVRDDVDTAGRGAEFITRFFPDEMETIQRALVTASGITLDVGEFMSGAGAGTLAVAKKVLDFGGSVKVNVYEWKSGAAESPRAGITLIFALNEDGTLTLSVRIEKDDPEYKPGYSTVIDIRLKPRRNPI